MPKAKWRTSYQWHKLREEVIKRDKKCQICGEKNKNKFDVHHLKDARHHRDLIFNKDNLITLCEECHNLFHNTFMGGTRKKCNKEDFERFERIVYYL